MATQYSNLDAELDAIETTSVPFENETYDVMGGAARIEARVHDHGFITLVDVMPRIVPVGHTADSAIVQAARVSYGQGTKRINEDRGLIRYLLRHWHTTPTEMVEFKFHCSMPMFVARQWIRHRTANVNEYSARYSVLPDTFYQPDKENIRLQSRGNRQGGSEPADALTAEQFLEYLDRSEELYKQYEQFVDSGISREQARIGLPVSVYTQWYWKCDLHNILHFLRLRMDEHAQKEIRDFAYAMFKLIKPIVPMTAEAFVDYRLEAMQLTRLEVEAIRNGGVINTKNSRERSEWNAKKALLGLDQEQKAKPDAAAATPAPQAACAAVLPVKTVETPVAPLKEIQAQD